MTYATNPDKTEQQFFTTGINCEVKEAVKQMQYVKIIYGKENSILAFMLIDLLTKEKLLQK